LIRLASEKPELRRDLLPLLKGRQKQAQGDFLVDYVIDRREYGNLMRKARPQAKLMMSIKRELHNRLQPQDSNTMVAVRMLQNLFANYSKWDEGQIANSLNKIADLLGLRTDIGF
jgi:hypothetical protein